MPCRYCSHSAPPRLDAVSPDLVSPAGGVIKLVRSQPTGALGDVLRGPGYASLRAFYGQEDVFRKECEGLLVTM